MCVCVCACVDAVPVQCEGGGWGVLCEMLCSHPPSHSSLTHAHSSGGQVSSSATAKVSANRGRGGGGGGRGTPPEQDGQSVDEYQGPHEGVCVCVRAFVRV